MTTNIQKSTDTLSPVPFSSTAGLTWDQATFPWDPAYSTWDAPYAPPNNVAKSTSTISTVPKS